MINRNAYHNAMRCGTLLSANRSDAQHRATLLIATQRFVCFILAPLLRATTTAATEDEIEDEMHDVFSAMREGSGPVCWACVATVAQMTGGHSNGNRPTNVPELQQGDFRNFTAVIAEVCSPM